MATEVGTIPHVAGEPGKEGLKGGALGLISGLVLLLVGSRYRPEFFRRRPEVVDAEVATRGHGAPQVHPGR
jgi:hypothetical protein